MKNLKQLLEREILHIEDQIKSLQEKSVELQLELQSLENGLDNKSSEIHYSTVNSAKDSNSEFVLDKLKSKLKEKEEQQIEEQKLENPIQFILNNSGLNPQTEMKEEHTNSIDESKGEIDSTLFKRLAGIEDHQPEEKQIYENERGHKNTLIFEIKQMMEGMKSELRRSMNLTYRPEYRTLEFIQKCDYDSLTKHLWSSFERQEYNIKIMKTEGEKKTFYTLTLETNLKYDHKGADGLKPVEITINAFENKTNKSIFITDAHCLYRENNIVPNFTFVSNRSLIETINPQKSRKVDLNQQIGSKNTIDLFVKLLRFYESQCNGKPLKKRTKKREPVTTKSRTTNKSDNSSRKKT